MLLDHLSSINVSFHTLYIASILSAAKELSHIDFICGIYEPESIILKLQKQVP